MIELLIKQIAEKIPPSSGANLLGFTQDLDYALWKSKDILTSYTISRSESVHQLITIRAVIIETVQDLQNVFEAVTAIWSSVAYRYFEASSYQYYKEAAVLRFITVSRQEEFFVSGIFVLQGKQYQKLISEHQLKIEKSYDSLPSMAVFEN